MKNYIFCCLLGCLLISCSKDEKDNVTQKHLSNDYFPLQIGNVWNYNGYTIEITDTTKINNQEYFELKTKRTDPQIEQSTSISYYRKTDDGKVFTIDSNNKEILKYDLLSDINHSWTYSNTQDSYKVTKTSNSIILNINGSKIERCIQFDYDIPQFVDDEYSIILAPGVGVIVNISYAWGLGDTLKSATINGIEYIIK